MQFELVLVVGLALINLASCEPNFGIYQKVYEQLIGENSNPEAYEPEDAVGIMDKYRSALPKDFSDKPKNVQEHLIAMLQTTVVRNKNCNEEYFNKMQSLIDEAPINPEVAAKHVRYFEQKQLEHCSSLITELVRNQLAMESDVEEMIEPLMQVLKDANLVSLPDMNIRQDVQQSDFIDPLYKFLDNGGQVPLVKRIGHSFPEFMVECGRIISQPCFPYIGALNRAETIYDGFGAHVAKLATLLPDDVREKLGKSATCQYLIYSHSLDRMEAMYTLKFKPSKRIRLSKLFRGKN